MQQLTLAKKLWGSLGITWFAMLMLVGWMNWQGRQVLQSERETSLLYIVESIQHQLAHWNLMVATGEMSPSAARQLAADALSSVRFGEDEYLIVFDQDLRIVVHPTRPIGADMSDVTDVHGKSMFLDMHRAASNSEGGFVSYHATRLGSSEPVPKITYVSRFADWGWYIATGVYVDDIAADFRAGLLRSLSTLLLIGIPVTLLMGWVIRNVTRRLGGDPNYAAEVVRHIANGDLTRRARLSAGDQESLLYDINRMSETLSDIIRAIHQSADDVNEAVNDIRAGNDELAVRTEQQAASLAETASSMEELTATVKQNADHAEHARQLASTTAGKASQGRASMDSVVEIMATITRSASQMSSIVDTIDGIAFQTNILALNASVEAARAGEQGRGFAVVASEVRSLASRSADAAREIKALIESAHAQVRQGSAQVRDTGEIITGMTDDMTHLSTLISEISTASTEQSHGIGQVNLAVTQMDQMTQRNAGLVQENTVASGKLASLSGVMREQMSRFKVEG